MNATFTNSLLNSSRSFAGFPRIHTRHIIFAQFHGSRSCLSTSTSSAILNALRNARRSVSPEPVLAAQRALSLSARTRLSSILQFIDSKAWNATHRSRISPGSSYSRPLPQSPWGPQGSGWQRFRQRLDNLPSDYLLWGVLALNGAVFAMWHLAVVKYRSTGDPSFYRWMAHNFTVSMDNFRSGRIWTLLTCCISHEDLSHFFVNAFSFYFMAPTVLSILGNSRFLALYLGGGLVSSIVSIFWQNNVKKNPRNASHGASGAIYSIVSFFACVAPTAKIYVMAIVPVPAWAFVAGIFLWDSYSAVNDRRVGTDTAGHVGGILAGILYFLRLRRII